VQTGTVEDLGVLRLAAPPTQIKGTHTAQLQVTLHAQDGRQLASNTLDILVLSQEARQATLSDEITVMMYHERSRHIEDKITIAAPDKADPASAESLTTSDQVQDSISVTLSQSIRSLGYRVNADLIADTRLLVTDYPNAAMLQWIRDGGDMLYLSSSAASPFFWRQGRGGIYSGDWITSFSWLRPGIYPRLEVVNPLSMPFMHIMPTGTIVGLPVEDASVQQDFLAGQIAGWLNHPAIHTVQFRYGRGRVIMTTFSLHDALLSRSPDPVGVAMFHDLIEHLASDKCQPVLTANY
jgi:hypothetical protein